MTSHCLILLSMVFPLQSISAHDASSFNGGLSLIQVVDHSNVEDLVPQIQRSDGEITVDVRSRKGRHSLWHRHRHLRDVRLVISFLNCHLSLGAIPKLFHLHPDRWRLATREGSYASTYSNKCRVSRGCPSRWASYIKPSLVRAGCNLVNELQPISIISMWIIEGHEILIIIGWGIMLPVGVIVARYFKEFPVTFNEWYQLHIMLQSVGYILGTIGWAIGICLGNTSRQSAYKTERILNTIVFTLTTIQILLAIFWQLKKGDKYRRWWKTCHHCLGYALLVLIAANILVEIQNRSPTENLKWAHVVILGVLALIALALEIYRWVKSKVIRRSVELNSSMYTSP